MQLNSIDRAYSLRHVKLAWTFCLHDPVSSILAGKQSKARGAAIMAQTWHVDVETVVTLKRQVQVMHAA